MKNRNELISVEDGRTVIASTNNLIKIIILSSAFLLLLSVLISEVILITLIQNQAIQNELQTQISKQEPIKQQPKPLIILQQVPQQLSQPTQKITINKKFLIKPTDKQRKSIHTERRIQVLWATQTKKLGQNREEQLDKPGQSNPQMEIVESSQNKQLIYTSLQPQQEKSKQSNQPNQANQQNQQIQGVYNQQPVQQTFQKQDKQSIIQNPQTKEGENNKQLGQKEYQQKQQKKMPQLPLISAEMEQKVNKIRQNQLGLLKKYKSINIQPFNIQSAHNRLGQSPKFSVKLHKLPHSINFHKHSMTIPIQIASKIDYTNISKMINFQQLDQLLMESISYQYIYFQQDKLLEKQKQLIFYQNTQLKQQVKKVVSNMGEDQQFQFAKQMIQNFDQKEVKLKQYQYYHQKYRIGSIQKETPICVYSAGHNIQKDRLRQYFKSLERQNYTNFNIVYVDDNSPYITAYNILEYLNFHKTRINNRISIVHNLQHLGTLASMFFWIRKYCSYDSIVVVMNTGDNLIGNQAFQVINSIYNNQQHWYVYSNTINNSSQNKKYKSRKQQKLIQQTDSFRTSQKLWVTQHLCTFRRRLMDSVPIQHFIQFPYNGQTLFAWPNFYQLAYQKFLTYTLFELAGNDRIVHLSDHLLLTKLTNKAADITEEKDKCLIQEQSFSEYKSRIKTPLLKLQNWDASVEYRQNYKIPTVIVNKFDDYYHEYEDCLSKYGKSK